MPRDDTKILGMPWPLWLLALAVRLFAWWQWCAGMVWPDEIFQSVEPAHHLAFGQGGLSWEWIAGARNWIAPFFFALWFRLQAAVGLDGPGQLLWGARFVSVLISLLVVQAAWKIGHVVAGRSGAWLAAIATALSPSLLYYAPRTLNDCVSAAFLALSFAFLAELPSSERPRRTAVFAGLLCGLAYIFRTIAPVFLVVPGLYLLLSRRWAAVLSFLAAFAAVAVAVGIVDWFTWGVPFHSTWHYLKWNFIDGNAAPLFGSAPFEHYAGILCRDLGVLAFLALAVAVLGARQLVPLGGALLLGLTLMSLTPHKEERFLLPIWAMLPMLLALGSLRVTQWLAKWQWPAAAALLAILLASQGSALSKQDWAPRSRELFDAMAYVARQGDVTGLAANSMWTTTSGYVSLHRPVPFIANEQLFDRNGTSEILHNEIINYVIADDSASQRLMAILADVPISAVATFGSVVVWRKAPAAHP
jgi:GPI mannosyltransferase 3